MLTPERDRRWRAALLGHVMSVVAATASIVAHAQPRHESRLAKPGEAAFGSIVVIDDDNDRYWTYWNRPSVHVNPNAEVAITQFSDRAARMGDILWLRLDNDRTVKFIDEGTCAGFHTCMKHVLVDWWPRFHYYVVQVWHGEGSVAYLVRAADGLIVKVPARPVLSPSGRYAVASNPSVMGDGETQLLDMRPDPPELVAQDSQCLKEFISVGESLKWIDDKHVLFDSPMVGGSRPPRSLVLRVDDGKAEWECR